jgi:hypothetical protein
MWSVHYDPFFLANYYRNCSVLRASYKVVKHAARCTIDNLGNLFNRGDWLVAHFRAIKSPHSASICRRNGGQNLQQYFDNGACNNSSYIAVSISPVGEQNQENYIIHDNGLY